MLGAAGRGEHQKRKAKSKARDSLHGALPQHGVQFSPLITLQEFDRPQADVVKQNEGVMTWVAALNHMCGVVPCGLISVELNRYRGRVLGEVVLSCLRLSF
jgi:hypothetical protein